MTRDVSAEKLDPKGLIREAFRIEGITLGECRTIFLDWALSVEIGVEMSEKIEAVLALYDAPEGHPMTQTLREGLEKAPKARRRGGRRARVAD